MVRTLGVVARVGLKTCLDTLLRNLEGAAKVIVRERDRGGVAGCGGIVVVGVIEAVDGDAIPLYVHPAKSFFERINPSAEKKALGEVLLGAALYAESVRMDGFAGSRESLRVLGDVGRRGRVSVDFLNKFFREMLDPPVAYSEN